MCSLRASNQAMKRAGLGAGVEEAESVMTELDEQIREASELTSVLATPLADAAGPAPGGLDEDLARELDMTPEKVVEVRRGGRMLRPGRIGRRAGV